MSEETYRQLEDAIERKLYVLGAGRIATLEDERDQARKHHSHEYQNRIELQGRIAELEAQLADEKWKSADREQIRTRAQEAERRAKILEGKVRDLEQTERDSRAEVASLIEGDGRAECADVEMTAVYDGGNGGGYEPHVRLYVRRGDRIYILAEDRGRYDRQTGAELSPPNREWVQLPPLPPIEPAKAAAEERDPAPPALARHDWHTHRGHVSCERCGMPFSEIRKDQACGAQPWAALPERSPTTFLTSPSRSTRTPEATTAKRQESPPFSAP